MASKAGLTLSADVIGFPIAWITTYGELEQLKAYVGRQEKNNVE